MNTHSALALILGIAFLFGFAAANPAEEASTAPAESGSEVRDSSEPDIPMLTSGTLGSRTELVAQFRHNGAPRCTAVLYPFPFGTSTTRWALTNEHCLEDEAYDSTEYSLHLFTGQTVGVDRIHSHPLADWHLGHTAAIGATGKEIGKVDVVLIRLENPVPVAESRSFISEHNVSRELVQESARWQGSWNFSYEKGMGDPSPNYATRMVSDLPAEGGDSGGPAWRRDKHQGRWVLEGLHGSTHSINHGSGFEDWLLDGVRCGVFDTGRPDTGFCTPDCPCGPGEGDCDGKKDCQPGLVCAKNAGDKVGLPGHYEICLKKGRDVSSSSGFCGTVGGCDLYEGDCNSHDECLGHAVCRPDVGAAIGLPETVDVCDLPRQAEAMPFNYGSHGIKDGTSGRCTAAAPCALGDGDCHPGDHSTCRGYLKCKKDVGHQFGYASNLVDVCVHPSGF